VSSGSFFRRKVEGKMDPRTEELLATAYGIEERILATARTARERTKRQFSRMEEVAQYNQAKVLEAFHYARIGENNLSETTGYGYGDASRDRLDSVYARVFRTESAIVRSQFVSGTHAIACALYSATLGREKLILATGTPYDTLWPVLGTEDSPGTIRGSGCVVETIELEPSGAVSIESVKESVRNVNCAVLVQRSCGYSWRESFRVAEISAVIEAVHEANSDAIVIVDNCYGEFVEDSEPSEVGADLMCGSLIKNPGGGLAPTGAYVAGRRRLVERAAERLTCPGLGSHVGSNPAGYRSMYQGLFMAPSVVSGAVRGAIFAARFFEELGFPVSPHFAAPRSDIIQGIKLGAPERVRAFCRGIQRAAAVDSFVRPVEAEMPGYSDGIIMAAGTFVQGASIELSADAPMREPYAVFLQGGLSFEHAAIGAIFGAHEMAKEGLLPPPSDMLS
jgi:cystathionine beta-lyase family protein involved in aluminum resistance